MKRLVIGILAHVDAGKTTLSEGLLYRCGALRRLGRVDHGDAFLDTDAQERARGITIFSKQALLEVPGLSVTLLDTPGHVDFSAEAERTLQVLDCAILVVSVSEGLQGQTLTLWKLLARYRVPVLLFVNKMDLPGPGRAALMEQLKARLAPGCTDFGQPEAARNEELALCGEDELLEKNYAPSVEQALRDVETLEQAAKDSWDGARACLPITFAKACETLGFSPITKYITYPPSLK